MHVVLGLGNGSGGVYIILQFVTLLYLQCVDMPYLVVCGHRARLSFQEASARTLVVLDVDGWKVKNTNIYIYTNTSVEQLAQSPETASSLFDPPNALRKTPHGNLELKLLYVIVRWVHAANL